MPDQRGYESTRGGPHYDIRLVRIPTGSQLDSHESRHLVGGTGDPAAAQNESYLAHPIHNRARGL